MTKKDVLNIAKLSNFEVNEIEIEKFTNDLENIVNILNKLTKINTEGIEPMYSSLEIVNTFREDIQKPYPTKENLIKLSQYAEDNVIVIPKVVG